VLTWLQRLAGQAQAGTTGLAQPEGGVGAFTQAMAAAVRAAGGEIRTGGRVQRILIENDRACGVRLDSGERIAADSVISNADPRTTFFELLGAEHLDTGFVRRIRHHRAAGKVAKLHLALAALPAFRGLDAAAHGGRLIISPTLDTLERSFNPAKYREIPEQPVMEVVLPTVHDASLAPPGGHVLSACVMAVPHDLGADPIAARHRLLQAALGVLEQHAPGLRASVIAGEVLAPVDLERAFGMTGGHWHHGALTFDQFFFNRPVPGAGRYRTPVDGLFLCGAGCHPGGDVMGIAGLNAAREVARATTGPSTTAAV
jgi:phytoene dehydrogenase-like protein